MSKVYPKTLEYFTNKYCQCGMPTVIYTDETDPDNWKTRCHYCGKEVEGF